MENQAITVVNHETDGGIHEVSEDGQDAENHTVKFDLERKNEPETINIDVVVPGADAIREAWNKLLKNNNKRKVSTSKEIGVGVKKVPHNNIGNSVYTIDSIYYTPSTGKTRIKKNTPPSCRENWRSLP